MIEIAHISELYERPVVSLSLSEYSLESVGSRMSRGGRRVRTKLKANHVKLMLA